MPIYFNEKSSQRIVHAKHCGDIQFPVEAPGTVDAVEKETVPVTGEWTDYTGSDTTINTRQLMLNPSPDKFQGTTAGLMGKHQGNLNSVGRSAQFTRQRQRWKHVNLA